MDHVHQRDLGIGLLPQPIQIIDLVLGIDQFQTICPETNPAPLIENELVRRQAVGLRVTEVKSRIDRHLLQGIVLRLQSILDLFRELNLVSAPAQSMAPVKKAATAAGNRVQTKMEAKSVRPGRLDLLHAHLAIGLCPVPPVMIVPTKVEMEAITRRIEFHGWNSARGCILPCRHGDVLLKFGVVLCSPQTSIFILKIVLWSEKFMTICNFPHQVFANKFCKVIKSPHYPHDTN
uniref:RNA-binding protein 1 n=1 Tax=Schistocephalus solidus TaxID=70667 RepID=A0A0V0JBY4_SCHSO